ncbi:hypothetical protein Tco_1536551 [Tanacetum coccineum]
MKIVPDEEEVAIDAMPLATKAPTIVDYKIHKEGKKSYYKITRADGTQEWMKCLEASSWCLMKLLMKKLEILKKNIKFKGGLLGLKYFLMLFDVTAALIEVNAAQSKLVLLKNFNEDYSKCLRLLMEVKTVKVRVTTVKQNLVLLSNLDEKYAK